jgi:hypothetical protein
MIVESGFPQVCHEASLPWCCYDRSEKKVVLRIASSSEVCGISLIYGDPYQYIKDGKDMLGGGGWVGVLLAV